MFKHKLRKLVGGHYVWYEEEVWDRGECPHPYVPWREGKVGEWMLLDDGYVVKCLRRMDMSNKYKGKRVYAKIYSAAGQAFTSVNCTYTFHGEKNWKKGVYRRIRVRLFVSAYVGMLLNQQSIDYEKLGRIILPRSTQPSKWAKKLTHDPEVFKMMREEVMKQVTDSGFTVKRLMADYDDLISMCKTKKDTEQLRLVLEHFTKIYEMLPATRTMSMNLNQQIPTGQPMLGLPERTPEELEMEKMLEAKLEKEKVLLPESVE
jgi:hypothetical protein